MTRLVRVVHRVTTTNVGQLIRLLEEYPHELPVEVGLGYQDETETYQQVTVTTVGLAWLAGEPNDAVVLLLGETGMLRAS